MEVLSGVLFVFGGLMLYLCFCLQQRVNSLADVARKAAQQAASDASDANNSLLATHQLLLELGNVEERVTKVAAESKGHINTSDFDSLLACVESLSKKIDGIRTEVFSQLESFRDQMCTPATCYNRPTQDEMESLRSIVERNSAYVIPENEVIL